MKKETQFKALHGKKNDNQTDWRVGRIEKTLAKMGNGTEEEIARAAGLTLKQTVNALYEGAGRRLPDGTWTSN